MQGHQTHFEHSNDIMEKADGFPGGVNSPVRSFRSVGGNPIVFSMERKNIYMMLMVIQYVDFVLLGVPLF